MARVVLAMSGGVDSSAAAVLLRRAGHDVVGLFMRHGRHAPTACATVPQPSTTLPIVTRPAATKQGCCSATDADDARRVADRLDIPFYALDFTDDFDVIEDYFVAEYAAGRTPNPCIECNNRLKFGRLLEYADDVGAEFVATGHHARLARMDGAAPALLRGLDDDKDQSYVLFGIKRNVLQRVMFPVGEYRKSQIRELAREAGLRVAEKPDSQEICFISDDDYAAFVRGRRGMLDTAGDVVAVDGTVVGRHTGFEQFTVGQRRGLGIAFGRPRYVVRIEPATKRVVVGTADDLLRDELTADRTNWLVDEPTEPLCCTAKIRYLAEPAAAVVRVLPDRRMHVRFDEPRRGVAPGQAIVCYDGPRVLGGGWIE